MAKKKQTIRLTVEDQLNWLVDNTTVKWIECHDHEGVVCGEKNFLDRFNKDQGDPISFTEILEPLWQKKFESFGREWNEERQQYRLLYDSMRSFFVSFIGLRINKVASINDRDNNSKEKILHIELAVSQLIQMYMSGKKIIDLFSLCGLNYDRDFGERFSETRNKLFEHNHNPRGIPNLILEPDYWSMMATKSYLPVYIHTSIEHEYEAYIDYYQDYYDLEKLFVDVVNHF